MKAKDNPADDLLLTPEEELIPGEVIIGQLCGISAFGEPLVDFQQNRIKQPLPAISTVVINHEHIGRQIALMFTEGNLSKPLVIGLIHSPLQQMIESFELSPPDQDNVRPEDKTEGHLDSNKLTDEITIDGKKIVLEGKEEIVFKCGQASITLTCAGKILIRGKYILNRSTGVNRILGGSVQVN